MDLWMRKYFDYRDVAVVVDTVDYGRNNFDCFYRHLVSRHKSIAVVEHHDMIDLIGWNCDADISAHCVASHNQLTGAAAAGEELVVGDFETIYWELFAQSMRPGDHLFLAAVVELSLVKKILRYVLYYPQFYHFN